MTSDIYKDYYDLQKKHDDCQEAIDMCLGSIYCVGGALNDNIKKYTKDQMKDIYNIAIILKNVRET